ncbi:iron chaperone [Devosia sp.]|uniref:iron chaperone n=1 Tax=Devosia sp. TaxID=1871048 RepID=UPI003F702A5C
MPSPLPETTRNFLAALPADQRHALAHLREVIIAAAPDAEEYVGYRIPAFRQDGALVSFGATRHHCALYVQSPAVMQAHAEALAGLDTSKGTVRFAADAPLPDELVTRLVKARLAENAARKAATDGARRSRVAAR